MVDFHTHILPCVDDGSKDAEQTLDMLRAMREQDIEIVAATPHFDMRQESIEEFLARRRIAESKMPQNGNGFPEVIFGAEVFCCGVDLSRIDGIERLCIGKSRCMLVETYFHKLGEDFADCMRKLIFERNITPVLAHAERYYHIGNNSEVIRRLSNDGMLLQMNAEAFIRFAARRKSLKLLKDENIGLLGSDCHNMDSRPPNLGAAVKIIERKIGADVLEFIKKNSLNVLKSEF